MALVKLNRSQNKTKQDCLFVCLFGVGYFSTCYNMNDYNMFKRCFFSPPSLQQPCCLDTITIPKQCSGEWKNNPKVVKQELLDQTTYLLALCVIVPATPPCCPNMALPHRLLLFLLFLPLLCPHDVLWAGSKSVPGRHKGLGEQSASQALITI